MTKKHTAGFTLVEIMIVVVIIGFISAIASVSYVKSNQTSKVTVCVANLEKIDAAIDMWVLENHIPAGADISGSEEEIYSTYIKGSKPRCPAGGEYTLHTVGTKPQVTCSKEAEGHKLP